MGNSLGSKKTAKIMNINGESFKLKTPVKAGTVVEDFPGHVLLESEAVRQFGIRAKPLEPHQNLESKRLYFMVELPRYYTIIFLNLLLVLGIQSWNLSIVIMVTHMAEHGKRESQEGFGREFR